MALTVNNLYKESDKYQMKLLAGATGLDNPVQWVHIIETNEGAAYLHGQELVITEGVREYEEMRLLDLVRTIQLRNASGIILNTGMYIRKVPEVVIEYCNEKNLPLFSVPWEVALVDVTREFCRRIMDNAAKEESITTAMKNLIFGVGDQSASVRQMERFGVSATSTLTFLCIAVEKDTEEKEARGSAGDHAENIAQLRRMAERTGRSMKEQYLGFEYQERLIVVLAGYDERETEGYLDQLLRRMAPEKLLACTYIGVGDPIQGWENQGANFHRAYAACEIALRKRERVLKYCELGLYKMLINIERRDVLTEFYEDTLGKLVAYDRENGTDYHGFVRTFIECDGHQSEISDSLFIHRNTVNNYVRKIEEICGIDLSTVAGKARMYNAYCAEDLL